MSKCIRKGKSTFTLTAHTRLLQVMRQVVVYLSTLTLDINSPWTDVEPHPKIPSEKCLMWNIKFIWNSSQHIVTNYLKNNDIGICRLQGTEVPLSFLEVSLNCNGYNLELELNKEKKRVGIYIRQDINYCRRSDLEKAGCHIIWSTRTPLTIVY